MRTHKRPSTFKLCHTCGALYSRKAKWCPYCRDDQGHLKLILTPQSEIMRTLESAPLSLRPNRKPLTVLAEQIKAAGYLGNVQAIARGDLQTKFPRVLAQEVLHEINGWHSEGRACLTCTHQVQAASELALHLLFQAVAA